MRANSGSVRNDGVAQARPAVAGETDGKAITKVALASAIGNTIEYYDFTLYATATALVFNKILQRCRSPRCIMCSSRTRRRPISTSRR